MEEIKKTKRAVKKQQAKQIKTDRGKMSRGKDNAAEEKSERLEKDKAKDKMESESIMTKRSRGNNKAMERDVGAEITWYYPDKKG